ncbi:MAG TPA: prepilin-type N-terminal cleavage/methylation domain-containing protein [Pirellulales bacterium]|jgi:prepilin-type N-terminal cleavage/methylation domain-containing protein|nr:prepilin-type N-terminal cleavage/methylation domain-containing protein [Pirellulales bacterium]
MSRRTPAAAGFTLIELMLVVLVMSIFAAVIVTRFEPTVRTDLNAVAQAIAGDMARARSLAVTNNGTYRFTFDLTNNLYYLEYSGSNTVLATLPSTPFYTSQDTATRQYTLLGNLPGLGSAVQLAAVGTNGSGAVPVTQVEFGNQGQTTQVNETDIWLTAGSGASQCWQSVSINPITGLATVQSFQNSGPPASILGGS